jgi:HPt (histidine-containing phosphotransfer) domain-containing protein
MSDTPRVDSYVYKFPGCQREPRLIDFARQLEREIAEARAEINIIEHDANVLIGDIKAELECKNNLIEQMRRALAVACLYEMSSAHMETIDAALSAAERGEIITLCRNCKGDKR